MSVSTKDLLTCAWIRNFAKLSGIIQCRWSQGHRFSAAAREIARVERLVLNQGGARAPYWRSPVEEACHPVQSKQIRTADYPLLHSSASE